MWFDQTRTQQIVTWGAPSSKHRSAEALKRQSVEASKQLWVMGRRLWGGGLSVRSAQLREPQENPSLALFAVTSLSRSFSFAGCCYYHAPPGAALLSMRLRRATWHMAGHIADFQEQTREDRPLMQERHWTRPMMEGPPAGESLAC